MKDLNNSFFRFNNMFGFDEFNQDEKQKNKHEEEKTDSENEMTEISDINSPAPKIDLTKERRVLTNWLDAEYNSAFQYKKSISVPITKECKIRNENPIDIEDPIIIYDYLKKYTNFLYDYNCPKEIERFITNNLTEELKKYYKQHSVRGLDEYLNAQFIKLKNKYLLTMPDKAVTTEIPKCKVKYDTEELINKLESSDEV